jgi:hypothetical protein
MRTRASVKLPSVARLARIVIPDVPHHVTQRGNRRQPVLFGEEDYAISRAGRRGLPRERGPLPGLVSDDGPCASDDANFVERLEDLTGRTLARRRSGPSLGWKIKYSVPEIFRNPSVPIVVLMAIRISGAAMQVEALAIEN